MKVRAKVDYGDEENVVVKGEILQALEFSIKKGEKTVWVEDSKNIRFFLPVEFVVHFCEEIDETPGEADLYLEEIKKLNEFYKERAKHFS